ncbi:hypothetical protein GTW25_09100 [Aliihoeflea aestuarii]|jgi:hypothetical protein|uniref:hypothetical protein n=1 Tax=Aliihoeflea aestuarii TaxID=453840 RepID=UPI002093190F|nr:hypothetical protein [Aliihoeflea aestuarii]MCO6391182.1 hypothetical protein [Aliihoeflea aestuarii]
MATAPGFHATKAAAIAVLAAGLVPGIAGAVMLPEHGPIPTERPRAEVADAVKTAPPPRDVVQISTSAQEIPEVRRNVRVVGANFLPASEESIDFASMNAQPSLASQAENFVMATVTRLFEGAGEEQPLQVAATTNQANVSP